VAGVASGAFRPIVPPSRHPDRQQLYGAISVRAGDPSPSTLARPPTRSVRSSCARCQPEGSTTADRCHRKEPTMRFDLFVPTVSEMATPEILGRALRGVRGPRHRVHLVGEHVVLFDDYRSEYPTPTMGGFPSTAAAGCSSPSTPSPSWRRRPPRCGSAPRRAAAPAQPRLHGQGGGQRDGSPAGASTWGVGVGWLREEFTAVGVDFARRGARTDEYLAVLEDALVRPGLLLRGEFYRLDPCIMAPSPSSTHTLRSTSVARARPRCAGPRPSATAGTRSTGNPLRWRRRSVDWTSCSASTAGTAQR